MANNKKNEVKDIFEEVDKGPVQASPRPPVATRPVSQPTSPLPANKPPLQRSKKSLRLLIFFIIVVVLGLGVILAMQFVFNDEPTANTAAGNNSTDDNPSATTLTVIDLPVIEVGTADEDGDGLSDEDEKSLGTNPRSIDTDQDGLFDREEVKIYKTDPLQADSDGDGNFDGKEVANGYDPNGPGVLLDLQSEIDKLKGV